VEINQEFDKGIVLPHDARERKEYT